VRKLLFLFAAVAVLAVGCGGGGSSSSSKPLTKEEYQAKLESTAKEIGKQLGSSQSDIAKMTSDDLKKFTAALHTFADKLQEIDPPAAVKKLHADLVRAINDIADEFPDIAAKLKATKDPSAAITILFGAKGIQELVKLGTEFKKAGYDLNLNGT
jgi:hypothetical protein